MITFLKHVGVFLGVNSLLADSEGYISKSQATNLKLFIPYPLKVMPASGGMETNSFSLIVVPLFLSLPVVLLRVVDSVVEFHQNS